MTVIDAVTEAGKTLTPYGYVAIGTVSPSLFSKAAPEGVGTYLRSAGHVSGKRCYAFVANKGLMKGRVLASLMKAMESEGMYLKRSDILGKAEEAEAVGARLHVEKTAG